MSVIHSKAIEDFIPNELNKANTFEGSHVIEFFVGGNKFGLGFWAANSGGGVEGDHPFVALLNWTPDGWILLNKLSPLWNDDLGMFTGSPDSDLENYMWFIEQSFTPTLQKFLADKGENTVPLTNWQKVLELLKTVTVSSDALNFNKTL